MTKNNKPERGLSLNTKLCSIASFFADVSTEMIFPILPLFITQVMGAPAFAVALIEGIGELITNLSNMIFGFYSDKIGKRKWFVVAGYSLSGLMKGFLVFVGSWWHILLVRSFERLGKGLRGAPRDSLIALSEDKKNIGRAIGFRKMMDNMGAVLGPLLCSILLVVMLHEDVEYAYKMIFGIGFIIAIVAVVATFLLEEKKTKPQKIKKIVFALTHDKEYRYFMYSAAVFALGHFSIMLFLLKAKAYVSIIFIPIVYLSYNVFYTVFSMPAGRLADKIGGKKALLFGWFVFLLMLFGFLLFLNELTIYPLFALMGIFMAVNETAPRVLITKIVEKEQYASALGSYKGITGTIALIANLIAGAIWDITIFSLSLPIVFAIITTIIAMVLFFLFTKADRHQST